MEVHYHSDKIWTIDRFLEVEACQNLISLSEEIGYEEAKVSLPEGAKMMKGLRNNDRLLFEDEELANRLWEKLAPFCPPKIENSVATGLNEMFRFYRYEKEQRFKRHIDGRFKRSSAEESRITFMVYLNDNYSGGTTKFDEVSIIPKTGTALCFIHEQKHEGIPLEEGIKYVLRSDVMYCKE
ncbi:MAG: 2OG-Fe(II) oxygenase [Flammeovirgaceae bacterium]|nr:2OG-Fe(II) oxygenase [Flammeovirgaceae bacterium]